MAAKPGASVSGPSALSGKVSSRLASTILRLAASGSVVQGPKRAGSGSLARVWSAAKRSGSGTGCGAAAARRTDFPSCTTVEASRIWRARSRATSASTLARACAGETVWVSPSAMRAGAPSDARCGAAPREDVVE